MSFKTLSDINRFADIDDLSVQIMKIIDTYGLRQTQIFFQGNLRRQERFSRVPLQGLGYIICRIFGNQQAEQLSSSRRVPKGPVPVQNSYPRMFANPA